MTTARLPLNEWRLLLTALCAGSPGWLGSSVPEGDFEVIAPTTFAWLARASWRGPGSILDSGVALLELAEPGTLPAAAWEPLCTGLAEAPASMAGPVLAGRFAAPGTGRSALFFLITDWTEDPADARVVAVEVRTDPD